MAGAFSPDDAASAADSKFDLWRSAIYERCEKDGDTSRLYTQHDLLDFGVIPGRDPATLLRAVQSLCNERLFSAVNTKDGLAWRWREVQEAEKYKLCTTEEQKMVFAAIDDAGGDGIWSQTLHKRLNMHDKVLRNAVKFLVAKDLVKPFKNVEHPNKRMYIKASIQPSQRAVGGPWFTDHTLDEAFIEELQRVIFDHIKVRGSYHAKGHHGGGGGGGGGGAGNGGSGSGSGSGSGVGARHGQVVPKKGVLKGVNPSSSARKRPADQISDAPNGAHASSSGSHHQQHHHQQHKRDQLLPLPAGFNAYPTVRDIARFIHNAGIITNTVLSESDVQTLVDVLVYDGLVEPVRVAGRMGYRPCRTPGLPLEGWAGSAKDDDGAPMERPGPPRSNGYTEVPCGRCPVFDLCEEGGPVSASNCVYFKKWLGVDDD